ncbi:hypothetical protein BM613_03810 [Sulfoacidibacillus thermotolerans]|uniref:Uncharacterized protein n=1 Tax=Sulfoacidibacillus thermotolerans TaxID=1765684 RepID=A0A2U3DAW7_SULT2|nr:hypothetical protein BM613_03810 [Sulfoacidibacillus thermotolerans]
MRLKELHEKPEVIEETLREHKEALQKVEQLGLRPLSPLVRVTIWGLRLYVLFMVVIVIVNVIQNL